MNERVERHRAAPGWLEEVDIMAVLFIPFAVCFGVRALVAPAAVAMGHDEIDRPRERGSTEYEGQPVGRDTRIPPGTRVRVRTGPRVEIPGVARFGEGKLWGADVVIDEASNVVTLSDGKGGRLSVPRPNHTFVGHVVAAEDGTLVVSLDGQASRVTIPSDAVEELEVSLGREKKRGRPGSALRGLGIGAGGGIVLGLASGDDKCSAPRGADIFQALGACVGTFTAGQKARIFGVLFGVIGGIVGAAGGGGEAERWQAVPSPGSSKLKVSLTPLGARGASVSISF
jgi:hypothetical protein